MNQCFALRTNFASQRRRNKQYIVHSELKFTVHCFCCSSFSPKSLFFGNPCLRDSVYSLTLGAFADTQKSLISSCVVHDRNPMNLSRLAQGEFWFPPWQSERIARCFALSALLQRTPKGVSRTASFSVQPKRGCSTMLQPRFGYFGGVSYF